MIFFVNVVVWSKIGVLKSRCAVILLMMEGVWLKISELPFERVFLFFRVESQVWLVVSVVSISSLFKGVVLVGKIVFVIVAK
ncbi:MAG: hypothetical protein LBE76_01140 [Nitrososphaerota archaeon]|nr:hypothetical protein [Nitrososphaerota archaeon]